MQTASCPSSQTACRRGGPYVSAGPAQAARNKTVPLETLADLREKIDFYRDELARFGRKGGFDICSGPAERPQSCDEASKQLILDQASEMAEMGVNWMLISMPGATIDEYLDAIAWFGVEVCPELPG